MEIFFDSEGMMVAINLNLIEAVVEQDEGYVSISTATAAYRLKGDFMETLAKVKKKIR